MSQPDPDTDYAARIAAITTEIHALTALRNAQADGDHYHLAYQQRITYRTSVLYALEASVADLTAADAEITAARRALTVAQNAADAEITAARRALTVAQNAADAELDRWWRVCLAGGVVGGLALAVAALLPVPSAVGVVGTFALIGAAVALMTAIRRRPTLTGPIDAATESLNATLARRRSMDDRTEEALNATLARRRSMDDRIEAGQPAVEPAPAEPAASGWPGLALAEPSPEAAAV